MAQDPKKQDPKKPGLPLHFLRSSDSPRHRSDGNAPPSPDSAEGAGAGAGASAGASAGAGGARPARKTPPVTPPGSGERRGRSSLSPRPGLLRRRASVEAGAEARPPAPAVSLAPAASLAPSSAPRDLSPARGRAPEVAPRPGAAAADPGEPFGADPYAPEAVSFVPGGWLLRTTVLPPQADNRRDAEGNTALMRAARDADFDGVVDLLSIPGTDVTARNAAGQGAYDLLRRAVSDRSCPEFVVVSQALFLRTMLGLLIREEHYAAISRRHAPSSPRGLAKKVVARLSSTYANQDADRALPFAAMPSLDFVEAAILAIQ